MQRSAWKGYSPKVLLRNLHKRIVSPHVKSAFDPSGSNTRPQDVRVPHRYTAPWIALGAESPPEAHISGTIIIQQSTEVQLRQFSSLRFVPWPPRGSAVWSKPRASGRWGRGGVGSAVYTAAPTWPSATV